MTFNIKKWNLKTYFWWAYGSLALRLFMLLLCLGEFQQKGFFKPYVNHISRKIVSQRKFTVLCKFNQKQQKTLVHVLKPTHCNEESLRYRGTCIVVQQTPQWQEQSSYRERSRALTCSSVRKHMVLKKQCFLTRKHFDRWGHCSFVSEPGGLKSWEPVSEMA